MDYKTVMVCLALDRANDACLAVAGDIAERFDARVVGIAASDLRPSLYFAEGQYAEKILGAGRAVDPQTAVGTRIGVSRGDGAARQSG